ncbi:MAG: CobB/CobQ domain protein glutamine amidotransferase [Magnetococcales bacterium]|nr:CobB/CobQ domain protein glutamine amidotransferase [Magnetococcales bacterium]
MTMALMARLRRENISIAPFKAGPDYLDPAWHREIVKRPSYNLDTFMVGAEACPTLFHEKRGDALGIVEGVMGLYDGRTGVGGPGSTADLARVLKLPVLLVVNVQGMAGSLVPLVQGFTGAAKGFVIAGILANRVGSPEHARRLAALLLEHHLPPLMGWMGREEELALQERHLGLTLPEETTPPAWNRLADALHLDTVLFSNCFKPLPAQQGATTVPMPPWLSGKHIAIARDAAFNFIYPANVECLERMGGNIHFFSPLAGDHLPAKCDAVWLPGGYPELHAETLSQSPTLGVLKEFGQKGGAILAECGGMMVLGNHLVDHQATSWPMAGLLPMGTTMTPRLAGLGYREEASGVRGHEFHHSVRDACPLPAAFTLERGDPGVIWHQIRASYTHWYFPSAPRVIAGWLGSDLT